MRVENTLNTIPIISKNEQVKPMIIIITSNNNYTVLIHHQQKHVYVSRGPFGNLEDENACS